MENLGTSVKLIIHFNNNDDYLLDDFEYRIHDKLKEIFGFECIDGDYVESEKIEIYKKLIMKNIFSEEKVKWYGFDNKDINVKATATIELANIALNFISFVMSINLEKASVTYKVENGYVSSEGFYLSSKDRAFNFHSDTPLEKVFDFMLTIQQYDI